MLDLWLGRKIKRVCWRVCVGRERECQRMKQASVNRTCSTIIYLGQIMNFFWMRYDIAKWWPVAERFQDPPKFLKSSSYKS